jgi:hypothetical protein
MEPIIPTSTVIQQSVPAVAVLGLAVGIAILTGATALMFLAAWEKKRKRSIC